jgi:hypothetical protein
MQPKSAARFALIVLALVVVGCATKPTSRAPSGPSAPRPPTEGRSMPSNTAVQYDKFTGSCRSWQNYISNNGVQDCAGRTHPGWIGSTRCNVTSTGYSYTPERDEGMLGRTCFNVKLPPNPNQFRVASACVRIVDWAPPGAINQTCADNRANWLDRVLVHEQQHASHCEIEVRKANQRWAKRNREFSGCGFTESGAMRELTGKIDAVLKEESRRVMDAIEGESERFHASSQGQPIVTNCNVCQ